VGICTKLSTRVCIEMNDEGVHCNYRQGCALQLSTGMCILLLLRITTNAHPCTKTTNAPPSKNYQCTPLSKNYHCTPLSKNYNAHPCPKTTTAHPCPNPWNSGPIQWARGGVGLKHSAAARPALLSCFCLSLSLSSIFLKLLNVPL